MNNTQVKFIKDLILEAYHSSNFESAKNRIERVVEILEFYTMVDEYEY